MTTNNECYICLDNINLNDNDFLELNCCKNNVHFNCLTQWYIKNNTTNCFICNQTNEICKELVNNENYIQIHPIHPINPIDPIHPINPINPVHPIHPINPVHPIHTINPINPIHQTQLTPIVYTKNKLTALIICYIINFFILINLIIILYS